MPRSPKAAELQFRLRKRRQKLRLLDAVAVPSRCESDAVDWQRGNYSLTTRGGRVESDARWGDQKKQTRMVAEGSVLVPRRSRADRPRMSRPTDFRIPCIAPASRLRFPFHCGESEAAS